MTRGTLAAALALLALAAGCAGDPPPRSEPPPRTKTVAAAPPSPSPSPAPAPAPTPPPPPLPPAPAPAPTTPPPPPEPAPSPEPPPAPVIRVTTPGLTPIPLTPSRTSLAASPAFSLEDGRFIRLGVEVHAAGPHTPFLVLCEAPGPPVDPDSPPPFPGAVPLGPVWARLVAIHAPAAPAAREAVKRLRRKVQRVAPADDSPRLHAAVLATGAPDDHLLEVADATGRIFAFARIARAEGPPLGWRVLRATEVPAAALGWR